VCGGLDAKQNGAMKPNERDRETPYVPAAIALRRLDLERARAIVDGTAGDDAMWAEDYPMPGDVEAAQLLLRRAGDGEDEGPFGMYEIIEIATGAVIGGVGFHRPPNENGLVEIGYGVVPTRWDQGFGTEAVEEAVELAQRNGARVVRARTEPTNVGSRRVLEKAGFSFLALDEEFATYEIDISL